MMNHRERVLTALSMEEPDRCPCQVSFTPEFAERLRNDHGFAERSGQNPHKESHGVAYDESHGGHNPHGGGNTYELERVLEEDMLLTSVGWANSYYQGDRAYTDEWGVKWSPSEYTTKFGKGLYTEIAGHPLADEAAIASYNPPDSSRPELYTESARVIEEFKAEYWIVGVTVTTIFETAWALRGLNTLLMDFIADPDLADAVLEIPYQYHLEAAKNLARMGVDMIWAGDDMGMQTGMIISPDTWRRFFKPRMAEFISSLKKINSDLKVAYHSDGNIIPIIPDLIEIGLDVLNPVQPACMDPAELKHRFGDKLCFWGSIDEQYTLPFGTPADVEKEVKTRLSTIGKGGGLIIGPTHHVQLDTPMENFWAMMNAIE